jgi:hypothetical protein
MVERAAVEDLGHIGLLAGVVGPHHMHGAGVVDGEVRVPGPARRMGDVEERPELLGGGWSRGEPRHREEDREQR